MGQRRTSCGRPASVTASGHLHGGQGERLVPGVDTSRHAVCHGTPDNLGGGITAISGLAMDRVGPLLLLLTCQAPGTTVEASG